MTLKQVLAALAAVTITASTAVAASPRGPESGLLNRIEVMLPIGDDRPMPAEFGTVRTLPAVQADSVLPAQAAEDGTRFTLLRYSAVNGAGVRLHMQNMHLAGDSRVFVYGLTSEGSVADVYGPYTGAGPMQTGEFWTPVIHGADAIVEVQFDSDIPADLPFEVVEIGGLDQAAVDAVSPFSNTMDAAAKLAVHRSLYQGVVVEHEIRDGMAVFEGDIILAPAAELKPAPANSKSSGRESTATSWTWSRWPGGVMPYTIDPALPNPSRVTDAINHWNTKLNGVIQIVPRTNQSNYVIFAYTSNAGYCASSVGMVGGAQSTYLGDYCATGNIIHEIGHDLGLWHEHTRNDRDTYVSVVMANISSSAVGNFTQTGTSGIDLGAYDYNSIMHYPAYAFSANGLPTIVTIPEGIPIGQRTGLSTGDIGGITQIYSSTKTIQSIAETISSNPGGVQLQVDGASVPAPYSTSWTAGSTHTVNAPTPTPANGQKLVFSNWSDGGAQSHTVTASTSTSVLTANYAVSYQLSTQVSPAASGSVSVSPVSADGYYAANSTVSLTATAAAGYCFSSWTGLLSGTPAQTSITMTKSYVLVANFVSCPSTTSVSTFTPIRVNAGGGAYTDSNGNFWSADNGFTGGNTYAAYNSISGTLSAPLYQSERWSSGTVQYRWTVPNATYTVNLKFAEIYFNSCGQRIFNIVINGQTVATNFDPCAAAGGPRIAVDRAYSVSVTGGEINVQLVPVVSNPKISAIEIVSGSSSTSSTSTTPPPTTTTTFSPIRVNAGGGAYTDPAGNVWSADAGFINGNAYNGGGTVGGTTATALYLTERWNSGTLQYLFNVPNATYTVNLKFAEIYFSSCGQRIFNIIINGQTVAVNFDPCAAAGGPRIAVDRSYSVPVTGGQINIQFVSVVSNPKVSAIEIIASGNDYGSQDPIDAAN